MPLANSGLSTCNALAPSPVVPQEEAAKHPFARSFVKDGDDDDDGDDDEGDDEGDYDGW